MLFQTIGGDMSEYNLRIRKFNDFFNITIDYKLDHKVYSMDNNENITNDVFLVASHLYIALSLSTSTSDIDSRCPIFLQRDAVPTCFGEVIQILNERFIKKFDRISIYIQPVQWYVWIQDF